MLLNIFNFQNNVCCYAVVKFDFAVFSRGPEPGPFLQLLDFSVNLIVGDFQLRLLNGNSFKRRQVELRPDFYLELELHRPGLRQLDFLMVDVRLTKSI